MPLFGIKKKEQLSEAEEFQEAMKEAMKGLMKVVIYNDMSDNDAPDRFAEELAEKPELFRKLNKTYFTKGLNSYYKNKKAQYYKELNERKSDKITQDTRNEMDLAQNLEVVLNNIDAYEKLAALNEAQSKGRGR